MTTNQESKLNMYLAVRNFIIQNETISKAIPKLAPCYASLESTISQIQSIGELQKDVKTGFAKDKKRLREALIIIAADNSRKLAAVAKFSRNETLMDKVRFNITELKRMTDVALKDYAEIIYEKVESNLDKLAEYENSPETQKVFRETISAYNTSLSTPRSGIAERRQATKRLVILFEEADLYIEEMDFAIGAVQLKNPDFINGYKTVRKIVDTSSGSLALKATALDKANRTPVKGVLFTFSPDGSKTDTFGGNGKISKKTAEKGNFNIKSMTAGTYKVLVSKPGYVDKEVTVSVADGERSEMVVELEKA